jgi:bacteriorhodopsin
LDARTILWITTIVMLVGGLAILAVGKRRTPAEGLQTVLHGLVPIIAACLYFAMATGQGVIILPTDAAILTGTHATRIFYFARYIDWAFTTPLLLVSLALTAMHTTPKKAGLIAGAVIADVVMIGTAFAFSASEVDWIKWTWFIISCVAFVGVYYVIWIPQAQVNSSERDDVRSSYRSSATILSVVWLIYPLILAVSPDGLNIVSDATSVLVIAILDVLAKVVYGLMAVASDAKATDRDLASTPATQSYRRSAA